MPKTEKIKNSNHNYFIFIFKEYYKKARMSSMNIVWYQQKTPRSASASNPASRTTSQASQCRQLSPEQEKVVERLSRPTHASSAKVDRTVVHRLHVDTYLQRNHYVWHKLPLFEDVKRCQWTNNGTVKHSTKI